MPSSMLASSSKRSLISRAFSARLRPSALSSSFHITLCLNIRVGLYQEKAGILAGARDAERAAGARVDWYTSRSMRSYLRSVLPVAVLLASVGCRQPQHAGADTGVRVEQIDGQVRYTNR